MKATKTMTKKGPQTIYFMCSKAEDGKWQAMPVSQMKIVLEWVVLNDSLALHVPGVN